MFCYFNYIFVFFSLRSISIPDNLRGFFIIKNFSGFIHKFENALFGQTELFKFDYCNCYLQRDTVILIIW